MPKFLDAAVSLRHGISLCPRAICRKKKKKQKCLVSKYTLFKLDMVTHAYNPSTPKLSLGGLYI